MQIDPTIFKAYDIRGVVGRLIDDAFAEHLGRAFGSDALAAGERARERRTRGQEGHGTEGLGLRRGIGMTAQDVGDGRRAQPSIAGLIAQMATERNRDGNRTLKGYAPRSKCAVIPDKPRSGADPGSIPERVQVRFRNGSRVSLRSPPQG